MPSDPHPAALEGRSPLWDGLPEAEGPTLEQLAKLRQQITDPARAYDRRRKLGRTLLPSALLLLLAIWRAHPDSVLLPPSRAVGAVARHEAAESVLPSAPTGAPASPPASGAPQASVHEQRSESVHLLAAKPHVRRPVTSRWQPEAPQVEAPNEEEEATLLGEALTRLHRSHDAPGALSAIARYSERFPRGQLAGEATLVQAEALSRLGRREELVARLDPDTIAQSPRPADLKLLRGEALAQLGRCREAIPVFTAILEGDQPELRERSLFGRALCSANEGRVNQARDDLSRIVIEYPKARPKVEQILDGLNR
jgi:hypothetical protein